MALVNYTQASILADISRATLYRHIQDGRVSITIDAQGKKVIDTAELERAYGTLKNLKQSHDGQNETPIETQLLAQTITFLETQLDDKNRQLEESKQREIEARTAANNIQDLLKHHTNLLSSHSPITSSASYNTLLFRIFLVLVIIIQLALIISVLLYPDDTLRIIHLLFRSTA